MALLVQMSSRDPKLPQPQLLSPKFFEQPLRLLPPSTFTQPVPVAVCKSDNQHDAPSDPKLPVVAATSDALRRISKPSCPGQGGARTHNKETEQTKKQSTNPADYKAPSTDKEQPHSHSVRKKIKLSSSEQSGSSDETTFNPKYDNQLLLVAENMSYTLAAKQRWKQSENLVLACASEAMVSDEKNVNKTLDYASNSRGNSKSHRDPREAVLSLYATPTLLSENRNGSTRAERTTSLVEKVRSSTSSAQRLRVGRPQVNTATPRKKLDVPNDIHSNALPTAHSENSRATSPKPAFQGHKPFPLSTVRLSGPVLPSLAVGTDNPTRNNLDEVRGSSRKPHTTDNLKPNYVKCPSTQVGTSCQKLKSEESGSGNQSEPSLPPGHKSKASASVASGEVSTNSAITVSSPMTKMAGAMDTESDLVLARVLQSEEYSRSGFPGAYNVVEQEEVKEKPKHPAMDCSSDFEIARRLQQELDQETAYSMQGHEHRHQYYGPGPGRRLGGDASQSRHEKVEGFYDNNNQYHYRITEHVPEYPDTRVGGGASATRRVQSHRHYRSGAAVNPTALSGEEMDMSYETLIELEDVSRGLDKTTISRLSNTYQYHPSSDSTDKSCSVCLCEFESGQTLRSLPCIHAFHENCIDKWLTNNKHCPVCMKDIDTM